MDYLGSADYLTSPVSGKVEAWTHYNEWELISHNAVLKCGQRELDLVKRYATHDYDSVLELYYAKARFYDAHDRRFTAVDPILDPSQYDLREYVQNPVQLAQYLYVTNSPLVYIDPLGLWTASLDLSGYIAAGWRGGGSISVVFDDKGHVGISLSGSFGAGTPGAGVGVTATFTNAESIYDMGKTTVNVGGSIFGWGLDLVFGLDSKGRLVSGTTLPLDKIIGKLKNSNKLTGLLSTIENWIGKKVPGMSTLLSAGSAADLHFTFSKAVTFTVADLSPYVSILRSYFKQLICKPVQWALKQTLGVEL